MTNNLFRPYAGMTRIRFKGLSKLLSQFYKEHPSDGAIMLCFLLDIKSLV